MGALIAIYPLTPNAGWAGWEGGKIGRTVIAQAIKYLN